MLIAGKIKTNKLFLSLQKPQSGGRGRDASTQEQSWGYSGGSGSRSLVADPYEGQARFPEEVKASGG